MGVTAAVAAVVVGAAGTYMSVDNSNRARKQASDAADTAQYKQDQLDAEAEKKKKDDEGIAAANTARDMAKRRQNDQASTVGGVNSTILTSPLGVQSGGSQPAGQKTLLGS